MTSHHVLDLSYLALAERSRHGGDGVRWSSPVMMASPCSLPPCRMAR